VNSIYPDYDLSLGEVYINFAKSILETAGRLDDVSHGLVIPLTVKCHLGSLIRERPSTAIIFASRSLLTSTTGYNISTGRLFENGGLRAIITTLYVAAS
jgi:hypothetical protein